MSREEVVRVYEAAAVPASNWLGVVVVVGAAVFVLVLALVLLLLLPLLNGFDSWLLNPGNLGCHLEFERCVGAVGCVVLAVLVVEVKKPNPVA